MYPTVILVLVKVQQSIPDIIPGISTISAGDVTSNTHTPIAFDPEQRDATYGHLSFACVAETRHHEYQSLC
jgi:hypothetical protein